MTVLYPVRFNSGEAHQRRVSSLRAAAELTADLDVPFRYVRYSRASGRQRGWYIVDFGQGEIALEKGQVELVLLGFIAALAVTQRISHAKVREWVSRFVLPFQDGDVPKPWVA